MKNNTRITIMFSFLRASSLEAFAINECVSNFVTFIGVKFNYQTVSRFVSQKGAQAGASVSVASRTNSRSARNSPGSFLDSLGSTIVPNVPAKVRPAPNVFFIT